MARVPDRFTRLQRLHCVVAAALDELMRRLQAHGQVGMTERFDERLGVGSGEIDDRPRTALAVLAAIDDAPDSALVAVPARVFQIDLVVPDDAVVKVGEV